MQIGNHWVACNWRVHVTISRTDLCDAPFKTLEIQMGHATSQRLSAALATYMARRHRFPKRSVHLHPIPAEINDAVIRPMVTKMTEEASPEGLSVSDFDPRAVALVRTRQPTMGVRVMFSDAVMRLEHSPSLWDTWRLYAEHHSEVDEVRLEAERLINDCVKMTFTYEKQKTNLELRAFHAAAFVGDVAKLAAAFNAALALTLAGDVGAGCSDGASRAAQIREMIINAANQRGKRALHLAAGQHKLAAVRWLLENGAEVDVQTTSGKTPLMCAVGAIRASESHTGWPVTPPRVAANKLSVVRELLRAGADATLATCKQTWYLSDSMKRVLGLRMSALAIAVDQLGRANPDMNPRDPNASAIGADRGLLPNAVQSVIELLIASVPEGVPLVFCEPPHRTPTGAVREAQLLQLNALHGYAYKSDTCRTRWISASVYRTLPPSTVLTDRRSDWKKNEPFHDPRFAKHTTIWHWLLRRSLVCGQHCAFFTVDELPSLQLIGSHHQPNVSMKITQHIEPPTLKNQRMRILEYLVLLPGLGGVEAANQAMCDLAATGFFEIHAMRSSSLRRFVPSFDFASDKVETAEEAARKASATAAAHALPVQLRESAATVTGVQWPPHKSTESFLTRAGVFNGIFV